MLARRRGAMSRQSGESELASLWQSRAALRAALFRLLSAAKSRKTASRPAILLLDLTKDDSLSPASDFHQR